MFNTADMKKIDLHIHTKPMYGKDADFSFDLSKLKQYVTDLRIDAIAVTNHNLFDRYQYADIQAALSPVVVFPGIEVDLCSGHILVIAEVDDLDDLEAKSSVVGERIKTNTDYLSLEDFVEIFQDLSKYLIIPHYDKTPELPKKTIEELKEYVYAGEVSSPKKFLHCRKDKDSLVPVLFSDSRMSSRLTNLPSKQTFVNIGDLSLKAIKEALKDRQKVSLDDTDVDLIDINAGSVKLSSGLSVILGRRSSGKSHTLQLISDKYGSENVKYIHQFSLTHREEEKEKIEFDNTLSHKKNSLFEEYIDLFKAAVDDIVSINDTSTDERDVENYIETLKRVAKNEDLKDVYSKCTLFNEYSFEIHKPEGLGKVISAVLLLLDNVEFKSTIDKHIDRKKLIDLLLDLDTQYNRALDEYNKKKWANQIMDSIHKALSFHSSVTPIPDISFNDIATNIIKRTKFKELWTAIMSPREIKTLEMTKFKIQASSRLFDNATDLKSVVGKKVSLVACFNHYNDPLKYIKTLKDMEAINNADIYKLFITIDYRILNQHGLDVSGGEWAEYNLLNAIQDARNFDMLLIDEPESSFDNIFLKEDVNELLKELAKEMPVVVVTHNNTIGGSIYPDYIVYTTKDIIDGKPEFSIYYGYPTDRKLKTKDGKEMENYTIQLDCLEAGSEAYKKRKETYENLKN